jgi:DNA polymerase delta subunit 1
MSGSAALAFQAIAWDGQDIDDQFTIRIFGRAADGKSVSLGTPFQPYFFIKPKKMSQELFNFVKTKCIKAVPKRAKDLWGFQNGELSEFIQVTFKSHKALRGFAWCVENAKWPELAGCRVYESNMDPVLRFMHVTKCSSTGWIDPGLCEPDLETTCDVNLWSPNWRFISPVARDDVSPLRIMSFDIECYSSTGAFPDPRNPHDVVFQIGMTTKTFGQESMTRHCLCLKKTSGPDVESFETERDLLDAFQKYMVKMDPDIITGWNIFGFDLEFLHFRSVLHGASTVWGRVKDAPSELVEKNLSSSALGNNLLKMVPMKGRYVFDLFQDVKREHKLESYSLNNVSKRFLSDAQKLDMPVKEIFSRYAEGDPDRLGEVAEYCIQDTVLPHKLMEKLCQIQNQIEMAKACWVPISFLSERGQQIKVFSQMAYKARELNFIIPTFKYGASGPADEGYEGATVLEAQAGAYYGPITALDFASLYPSIMCAHNLCYSTLVMDPKYDNLPGVEYEQYGSHRFAQNVPSLLPVILTDLKAFRKKAKKLMAQHEGTPMEAIYNGQQLAYKISMNSIYGFTGASKGMLPCVAIASTVTMRGRQMIEETKNYVEEHFPGAKVRYGDTDSVMVEFDVQGRKGQDAIDYSWQLGEQAAEQCTKLFKAPNDLELEKVYCPYFLYSKKRYAAKMYEGKCNKDGTPVLKEDGTRLVAFKKIDVKGLQVVRRDSCPFVRETLKELLNMVLESSDPTPVIAFAREEARKLMAGEVPMEKLLMSKQLASAYKVVQPHVMVRDKMKTRVPGSEPQQGDRVAFVIVKGDGKMCEKAEDPTWARDHKVPLDYQYYFTNQFKKPVQDLLEPLVNPDAIFDKKFMVKTSSTAETEARKAFLAMFSRPLKAPGP